MLTGYTAYGKNGTKYTGSMENKAAWTNTPTTNGKVTIPAGYHSGNGYVDTSTVYKSALPVVLQTALTSSQNTKTVNIADKYTNYKNITSNNIVIGFKGKFSTSDGVISCSYDSTTGDIRIIVPINQSSGTVYIIIYETSAASK